MCELTRPTPGGDRWLWSVAGDVPSAYFVLDQARDAATALRIYCALMTRWVEAVRAGTLDRGVFPVRAAPTAEHAAMLASRVATLLGWLDAGELPRTHARWARPGPAVPRSRARTLGRGRLVLDNQDRLGIAASTRDAPSRDWLAVQRDTHMRRHTRATWWQVLPLSGGSILAPAPLLRPCGVPSRLQHAIAWRNANEHGRRQLRELLGELPF